MTATPIMIHDLDVLLTRKRIKNIILRISKEGQISVSAPLRCPMKTIEAFLFQKRDWIIKHRERFLHQWASSLPLQIISGEQHRYLGHHYDLMVYETAAPQKIILEENRLCCFVKTDATVEEKHALLQDWHRAQMKAILPALIQKWEVIVGVKVNQLGIKVMNTRWGSCNTTHKRIWLNLCLIHYPLVCLEYVLVHELVHLLEASHNKRFHALMGQFMPEWKEYRGLLLRNAPN